MTKGYFFDTYATIELIDGNPAYAPYKDAAPAFTKLNLFEVYFYLLRTFGIDAADKFNSHNYDLALDFGPEVIREAAQLKFQVNRNISMTDAIGYVIAGKLGLRFLTGDKQFEDLPNVEFVK
ncbi:hypothetical protein HZC09_00325 [Candidatus Micrarchaeota archaeon]|nr:hypothetical protein [Candidatus Micrarchaeota archaeon]